MPKRALLFSHSVGGPLHRRFSTHVVPVGTADTHKRLTGLSQEDTLLEKTSLSVFHLARVSAVQGKKNG